MGERLNIPELQKEASRETKRNVFRETLASLGYVLVGNPNVNYRSVVDGVCDKAEAWGLKVRNSIKKKP